jgi:hypothetical protein
MDGGDRVSTLVGLAETLAGPGIKGCRGTVKSGSSIKIGSTGRGW